MPLSLKQYQLDCRDALRDYFVRVSQLAAARTPTTPGPCPAEDAFYDQTRRKYFPVPLLPELPYICLRLPTGGGKTFLAAHCIDIATRHLLRQDVGLVLWLRATGTIVDQTLTALRNRRHPYREALDAAFGGNVTVIDLSEALYIQRSTLDTSTVVIVSTIQALRVEDTQGRKIYEANGALMPSFTGLSPRQIEELAEDPTPSLANALRLRHPIVIMDEAHNARTDLTFQTLKRFAPSCVVELTATPENNHNPEKGLYASNVLYSVSAAQLKADGMIKLPIRMKNRPLWKEAASDALAKRNELEKIAIQEQTITGEYIRPIILFAAQSQKADDPSRVTAEVLKAALIEDFKLPPEQIAIATGEKDEIGGKDIFSTNCPLRFIITVNKLREGWDCSFAYVLCSVSNLSSKTAVEQILGRVLRLPHAMRKKNDQLNAAYAYVTSNDFHRAAMDLKDTLIERSGFTKFDTDVNVVDEKGTLFSDLSEPPPSVRVSSEPDLATLPEDIRNSITFAPVTQEITWTAPAPMTETARTTIEKKFTAPEDQAAVKRLFLKSHHLDSSPAAQGQPFRIPQLAIKDPANPANPELFEDQFLEVDWKLSACDPVLSEKEFVLPSFGNKAALLDVDKEGKFKTDYIMDIQNQLSLFEVGPKMPEELAVWMSRKIDAPDILHDEKVRFLHALLKALIDLRQLTLDQLLYARFRLVDASSLKIDAHRLAAAKREYQRYLDPACATPIEVTPAVCFEFPLNVYPAPSYYDGPYKFQKHYYRNVAALNKEEAVFAVQLDSHPKVKFWVKNLVRGNFSFWLQCANKKFYPDFIAMLTDGRYLVIEYKGEHLTQIPDTLEKTTIGKLWEARSAGKCVFRIATKKDAAQILAAI